MSTRQNDTMPDPAPSPERPTEQATGPDAASAQARERNGFEDASDAPPISPSEAERMDQVLRSLARRRVMVPNSLEPGVAHQGQHAPAAARGRVASEPATLLDIPTDPPASDSLASDSRNRTTVTGWHRGAARFWTLWAVLGVAVLGAGGLFALAMRANRAVPSPATAAPFPEAPRALVTATPRAPSAAPPARVDRSSEPQQRDSPETTRLPLQATPTRISAPRVREVAPATSRRHPEPRAQSVDGSAHEPIFGSDTAPTSSSAAPPAAPPTGTSSAPPMPLFELLKETR